MASAALMASAAWRVALVQALAASLWPPRALALERVVVSSLPRVLVQALAVVLSRPRAPVQALAVAMPRALAQPLVVALMMPRALVQGPRAALGSVLPGP